MAVSFDLAVDMALTLAFLPLLLREAPFAITSEGRKRKRNVWKPSLVETMENFIDIEQVFVNFSVISEHQPSLQLIIQVDLDESVLEKKHLLTNFMNIIQYL